MIFLGILFSSLCAFYDKGKRFENHIPRFLFRVLIALIFAWINVNSVKDYFVNFLQFGAGFYFAFDYILNIFEKRKWNYIGDTSKIDIFAKKYLGWELLLLLKIIFVILVNI